MSVKKKFAKTTVIVVVVTLIFISPIFSNAWTSMFCSSDSTGLIYNMATAADTQLNIWKLCEEQNFSCELLLSIYHTEGINNRWIQEVEKDISELTFSGDYWADKGYTDEDVFPLMIISSDRSFNRVLISSNLLISTGRSDLIKDRTEISKEQFIA